jgi:CRP-like cAMP-binding protein
MPSVAEHLNHHFPTLGERLSPSDGDELARSLTARTLADGEVLLEEGVPSDALHLLCEGALVVTVAERGQPAVVGRVAPGALLGEVSLMDEGAASGSVRAEGAATILSMRRADLLALHKRAPRAATAVLRAISVTLAGRVRTSSDRLEALTNGGTQTKAEESKGLLGVLRSLFGIGSRTEKD